MTPFAFTMRKDGSTEAQTFTAGSTYKHDFFAGSEQPKPLKDGRLADLKAFLMQVAELEEVQSGRRLPERVLRHLMGTGILRNGQSSAPFIRLLSEYRREWLEVTQQAEQRGYSWTKLLAASGNTPEGASRASA